MKSLETRAKALELQAEMQRLTLAMQLDAARKQSHLAWSLPLVTAGIGWLVKPSGRWLGLAWMLSRLYVRTRKAQRSAR
jgi:hypothetical protein